MDTLLAGTLDVILSNLLLRDGVTRAEFDLILKSRYKMPHHSSRWFNRRMRETPNQINIRVRKQAAYQRRYRNGAK